MIKYKNTKEIASIVDKTSPEARAARLRRLRNMANLSRHEMCSNEELNLNTYKGWEIARYGGLPPNAASKVIKRLATAGVVCDKDWLLTGKGREPYLLPNPETTSDSLANENQLIINEITLFAAQFNQTVYAQVIDDTMLPFYQQGDYVAGIKLAPTATQNLLNTNCIIFTSEGELLIRHLKAGSQPERYTLFPANVSTTHSNPVLYDVQIEYVARIVRHYSK